MPSSYHGFMTDVVDIYLPANPQKVLDIGVGFCKWGMLFREYGDVFRGRLTPKEWIVQLDGVEAFEGYKTPIYDYIYNKVYFEDIRNVYTKLGGYDFVYAGDVIEHLEKSEAKAVLDFFKKNAKIFVVSIPLSDRWPQGAIFNNKFEEHRSIWNENDFDGYQKIIKKNPSGKPIGLFIHRN